MKYFIGIVFSILSFSMMAQEIHLGLRIGLNSYSLDGPLEENASFKKLPGFHIGTQLSIFFF
jgi:hypothetical protein